MEVSGAHRSGGPQPRSPAVTDVCVANTAEVTSAESYGKTSVERAYCINSINSIINSTFVVTPSVLKLLQCEWSSLAGQLSCVFG